MSRRYGLPCHRTPLPGATCRFRQSPLYQGPLTLANTRPTASCSRSVAHCQGGVLDWLHAHSRALPPAETLTHTTKPGSFDGTSCPAITPASDTVPGDYQHNAPTGALVPGSKPAPPEVPVEATYATVAADNPTGLRWRVVVHAGRTRAHRQDRHTKEGIFMRVYEFDDSELTDGVAPLASGSVEPAAEGNFVVLHAAQAGGRWKNDPSQAVQFNLTPAGAIALGKALVKAGRFTGGR